MELVSLKKLGKNLLDLLFPIACLVCGQDGVFLCSPCADNLPKTVNQICISCQKPSPFGRTHPVCVTRNSADGLITAIGYKNANVAKIIGVFKYNFVSGLSIPLARLLFEQIKKQNLADYFSKFMIIPVPLHKRRFNWRGFNQSELLAKALAEKLNTTFDPNQIIRIKHTKPQTKLKADERKQNITDAFSTGYPLNAARYLIIDDVATSGATINELAKLLKKSGASEVWAATVAQG